MMGRGCKSMRRLISASLDGELSPEDEQLLQAHLDSCADCRQVRDAYRANRNLIQHNLPDNSDPPSFVTDEILRRTREISNSRGLRRLILGSRLRLTMSVIATIAVVIIASAFFLVQNYRAGISPAIAGFQPSPTQEIDFLKPVTITFNHPMNDVSVMNNLVMSQQQADFIGDHYYHWSGSSLIIGVGKNGQTRPFTPASVYTIWIMPAAKDANGNVLGGEGWKVSFRTTSATKFASSTPTATPSPSATSTSIAEATGSKPATTATADTSQTQTSNSNSVPTSNSASQTSASTAQNQGSGSSDASNGTSGANPDAGAGNLNGNSAQTTTTPKSDVTPSANSAAPPPAGLTSETNGSPSTNTPSTPNNSGTPPAVTATPSAAATQATPGATPTSTTTSTATGTVADATPTGSATTTNGSTSTVTAATTATATTTATQSAVAGNTTDTTASSSTSISKCAAVSPNLKMAGAFGSVYYPNVNVCTKLGQPQGDSTTAQTSILTFQRGVMIERADTKKIYILASNGTGGNYQVVDAPSPSIADNVGTPTPSGNLWIPGGDLGKVWSDNKLEPQIGDATSQSADTSTATPVQAFQNGSMIYSDAGFVYVLYNDNTWQVYPDTSGHGALLTPTATTPSPAGTTGTAGSTTAP